MTWEDFKKANNFRKADRCCENCKHGMDDFEGECYCDHPKVKEERYTMHRGTWSHVCDAWEQEERAEKCVRPPIGLMPRYIHDEQRAREIIAAVLRYLDAVQPVPREWLEELFERIKIKEGVPK